MPTFDDAPAGPGVAVSVLRQVRGFAQAELAKRLGVSQSYISKLEAGQLELADDALARVAAELMCPPELLTESSVQFGPGASCVHHRRRKSRMSAASIKRVEGIANLTSLSVTRLLSAASTAVDQLRLRPLVDFPLGTDPAEAAAEVRRLADLEADQPLDNAIALVESFGVVVVRRKFSLPNGSSEPVSQDGVSLTAEDRRPVVILNERLSADRERMTVLHEFGHIVLHRLVAASGDAEIEAEATRFAAELLMPAAVGREELRGVDETRFARLLELKARWGMSVGALVEHGVRLGSVDASTHLKMRKRLVQMGWDRVEPGQPMAERPRLLTAVVRSLKSDGWTEEKLARAALMDERVFRLAYAEQLEEAR